MYQELINLGPGVASIVVFMTFWAIAWKGFALWISAQEGKKWWFILILAVNTVGVLEIIYIFFFSTRGKEYVRGWGRHLANKKVSTLKKRTTKRSEADSSEDN